MYKWIYKYNTYTMRVNRKSCIYSKTKKPLLTSPSIRGGAASGPPASPRIALPTAGRRGDKGDARGFYAVLLIIVSSYNKLGLSENRTCFVFGI